MDGGGRKKKKRRANPNVVCKYCGKQGHSRRSSKQCDQYQPTTSSKKKNSDNNLDADEADQMDQLPLDEDPPSDLNLDEFFEAEEFDSETEGITRGCI